MSGRNVTHRLRRPRGREGFTLIEVLVAMVILAVGLLALEAMGIGAARMVARADEQSEYTAMASEELELALARVVRGPPFPASGTATRNGAQVATVVTRNVVRTRQFYTVSITVTPPSAVRARLGLSPITMVGSATR